MNDTQAKPFHERLSALEVAVSDIQRVLGIEESVVVEPALTAQMQGNTPNGFAPSPSTDASTILADYAVDLGEQEATSPLEVASIAFRYYAKDDVHPLAIDIYDQLSGWQESYPERTAGTETFRSQPDERVFLSDPEESLGASSSLPLAPATPSAPSFFNFTRTNRDIVRDASFWLSKVGILLFLFGVVFLFKYSIDRHWLDEQARVGAGLVLGAALLAAGFLVHRTRRHLSQILMGGSIATFYITGYAAYQLFPSLHVSYVQAFLFMSAVTLVALVLSAHKGEVSLALIGLLGGIFTPFALGASHAALPAMVGYTCLLVAASSAIYFFRGWRSVLGCGVLGGSALLFAGYFESYYGRGFVEDSDRWALQGGLALILIAFWLVPVIRETLTSNYPVKWPCPSLPAFLTNANANSGANPLDSQAYLLSALAPLGVLFASIQVWEELVSAKTWGLIEIAGAVVLAIAFLCLNRLSPKASLSLIATSRATNGSEEDSYRTGWASLKALAYVQAMMAILALTLGLVSLLDGNLLLLALAVEGVLLHVLSRRFDDRGTAIWGHIVFTIVGAWLVQRILLAPPPEPTAALINWQAATDLLVMALVFAVSFLFQNEKAGLIYRSVVHAFVLGWLWRELNVLPDGYGYVMLAWAVYGLGLHLISQRVRDRSNSLGTSVAAHLAFEGAIGLLAFRLAQGYEGIVPMFNQHAALDLAVIGLALASSFVVKRQEIASIYRIVVHMAVLGWLWREAADMDGLQAQGYVMLRWAAYLLMATLLSHKIGDRVSLVFLNAGYLLVACVLGLRILSEHGSEWALLNIKTGVDVFVVCLALVATLMLQPGEARLGLRAVMHAAVLGILWRELSWLSNGLDLVVLAWAVYAVALQAFGWWRKDRTSCLVAHVIFSASALWLLERIAYGLYLGNEDRPSILTTVGLANLGVIVVGALIYYLARKERFSSLYGLWLHVAFLAWIWQELGLLPNGGNGYVTIAWGAYAIVLVVVGLRMELNKPLVYFGLTTLFIVAGKLFLIDLRYLESVWRILLFLGFGGLFLLLSYVFQGLSKRPKLEVDNADL